MNTQNTKKHSTPYAEKLYLHYIPRVKSVLEINNSVLSFFSLFVFHFVFFPFANDFLVGCLMKNKKKKNSDKIKKSFEKKLPQSRKCRIFLPFLLIELAALLRSSFLFFFRFAVVLASFSLWRKKKCCILLGKTYVL